MNSLDLYRTTLEGTEWVGTFGDLDSAKAKLLELAEDAPGDYGIFDQSKRRGFSTKTILNAAYVKGQLGSSSLLAMSV